MVHTSYTSVEQRKLTVLRAIEAVKSDFFAFALERLSPNPSSNPSSNPSCVDGEPSDSTPYQSVRSAYIYDKEHQYKNTKIEKMLIIRKKALVELQHDHQMKINSALEAVFEAWQSTSHSPHQSLPYSDHLTLGYSPSYSHDQAVIPYSAHSTPCERMIDVDEDDLVNRMNHYRLNDTEQVD